MKFRQTNELNQDACNILRGSQLLQLYGQLRRGPKRFLNKAIRINQTGEPFTIHDFPELTKPMWKKYVFLLRKSHFIESVEKSVYAYYRIRGFRLNDHWEKVTSNPTGVSIKNMLGSEIKSDDLYQLLRDYLGDLDSPALHNIRLHFYHDFLYSHVKIWFEEKKSYNISYNSINKSFTINPPLNWEHLCSPTIIIARTGTVQILIKNTLKPLVYNENGVYTLILKLGEIKNYLEKCSQGIPPVLDWLFVRADFGRDSKRPVGKLIPTIEVRDFAGALVRLYAKSWPNGEKRLRVEKIIHPNKPLKEMLEDVLEL